MNNPRVRLAARTSILNPDDPRHMVWIADNETLDASGQPNAAVLAAALAEVEHLSIDPTTASARPVVWDTSFAGVYAGKPVTVHVVTARKPANSLKLGSSSYNQSILVLLGL